MTVAAEVVERARYAFFKSPAVGSEEKERRDSFAFRNF